MLRLFISHSSKNKVSKKFLRKLCSTLQANDNGCYVLVDKSGDIYPSDDWEKHLDEWLAECYAAVILVSEAALKSWWVQKEATILKWRWRLDPNFNHLFIVLLDGLQEDVFQQDRFKMLNISQVQFLTGHNSDPARIVELIEEQLEEIESTDTSFDEMREAIADSLSNVKPKTLVRVCQNKLQVEKRLGETIKWTSTDNSPQAEALARLILRDNQSSLKTFNDVLNAIKPPIPHDSADWLFNTVFPLWICQEAAVPLPLSSIDEVVSSRRFAINGKKLFLFTAESFVRRAYPLDDDWVMVPIDSTKTQADDIAKEIRSYFREHITEDSDASDAETDEAIRTFPSPVYILLAENITDEYILDELQSLYPNTGFLLSVGAKMPADSALPANAVPINPPVDIELEEQQNIQMHRARNLLNKLPGGLH